METEKLVLVFVSVIALGIKIVIQIITCQITRGQKLYQTILAGFMAGIIAVCALTILSAREMGLSARDSYAYLILNALCYVCLAYGYFQSISLNVNSLRVRIAKEILAAGGQKPIESLTGEYNADQVIEARLERLTQSEQLTVRDGRYFSGKKSIFLTIGMVIDTMRWLILGKAHLQPKGE